MTWGDSINTAIARRDTTALRRLAERTRRKEVEMFLRLVAEMVERELRNTSSGCESRVRTSHWDLSREVRNAR